MRATAWDTCCRWRSVEVQQRGLVAVAGATAWDTCCCWLWAAGSSVGALLLFVPRSTREPAHITRFPIIRYWIIGNRVIGCRVMGCRGYCGSGLLALLGVEGGAGAYGRGPACWQEGAGHRDRYACEA